MTSPPLAREMPDGSRMYVHPRTGETAPSVTTVIGMLAKPKLVPWAARMSAEYAVKNWKMLGELPVSERVSRIRFAHERIADEKADLGDAVHELVEAWQSGNPHPDPPREISSYVTQFIRFLTEKRPRFLASEFTVWSRTHGYAGTADWLAEIDGQVIAGDNKTGRRVYEEVAMQLSALAGADFIITPDGEELELPQISALTALHIRPRSWRLVPVRHREESFRAFLACRELWHWQQNVAPGVLGES